ncbi:hypothetical protein [Neobacillus sp. LXY-1]|uniref:hypothetical protein n=1 Tax=Neobacillus sp. LXY-1 TaxID=3379133 RepID=UPI003EDFDF7B
MTYIKVGYPHLPKTIKLCGVDQCENIHYQKGLCEEHYYDWINRLLRYGLGYQLGK